MRVLGVEIAGTDTRWIIVDGDDRTGNIEHMSNDKVGFPRSAKTPAENYQVLQQIFANNIRAAQVDCVAVIRADQNSGVNRSKIECLLEMACRDADVTCSLFHANSIASVIKNIFPRVVGAAVRASHGSGKDIEPKYLERAFYCAWRRIHG